MNRCVLAIDEDVTLLAALKRQFGDAYDLHTAHGSEEALTLIRAQHLRPAAVICDMHLTGLDGIKTLSAIEAAAPDATRLMLAGGADLKTAMDAINGGHVFRFLTKPCSLETLRAAIDAGIEQHRLITAEHDLLEKTLAGSVKVLTDVLALAMPEAFSRANRVAAWVQILAKKGFSEARWQLNLAALLAPLGLVSLPPEILGKLQAHAPLSEADMKMVQQAPQTARRLIANIPRLKPVAEIVFLQNRGFDGTGFPEEGPCGTAIPPEARLLHILNALAAVSTGNTPSSKDFALLCSHADCYDLPMLERVRAALEANGAPRPPITMGTWLLRSGMFLAEPVLSNHGSMLLASGIQLSETHLERLLQLAKYGKIRDKVSVCAGPDGQPLRSQTCAASLAS